MTAIRCEGLTKYYGKVVALTDLDLVVEPNTIFGFLGPNGAGKTTTIKLLTGLTHPTRGRAWVAGEQVTLKAWAMRARIGYLPEEPAFYDWMSGREFLTYVGRLFGIGGSELMARVEELLDLVDLDEAAGRRIGGYSRGMRQRLGIAQALINRPEVLFLDEPCSALDPVGRKEILDVITRLGHDTTVFMSTHILADVERVCDSVGIIDRGRLVVQAEREELQEQYAPPVFELEAANGASPELEAFAARLRALDWIESVESIDRLLRVHASDVQRGHTELLPLVVSEGLALSRYELVRPSLEDVFLRIIEAGD